MAVTVLPDSSMTDAIKLAVRSTTTCTDATVLSLQSLLRTTSSRVPEKPTRRATKSTKESSRPTSRAKNLRTTKTPSTSDAVQALVDQDATFISPQEKLLLATEVFNTTLKTLTEALKLSSGKRQSSAAGNSSPTSAKRPNTTGGDAGVQSAAECARLALSTLRSLKNEQSGQELPNMQLEQGVCVLVGKLISLGLNDMACKELRSLKRRIQQHLDTKPGINKTTKVNDPTDEETGKERMSDILTFSNLSNAKPLYGLLVQFHANAMRLLASDRKASTTQKLLPLLQLSDARSPAQIIISASKSGSLTNDKAALQLQLLSNTVLSLCPGRSSSAEDSTTNKDALKPITILNLQLLSLEIRCLGWKMSGHICNEAKEVFDPLLRYLGSYSQRSKVTEKADFATLFKAITRIQSSTAEIKKTPESKDVTSMARIMTTLGQLALDAGCLEDSLKLFTKALTPLTSSQSLSLATVQCKIASVSFQGLKSSEKFRVGALKSTSNATASLALQLRGSASDLDELLVEAARLKKLALSWFGDAVTKSFDSDIEKDDVTSTIREYLQAFVRFLRRFVGRSPGEDSDAKEQELFKGRVSMSKSIILAAVDSSVAVGKLSIMSKRPPWDDMVPIFTDCHRLLASIESSDEGCPETSATGAGFVKLSNLFWSRYIKEKEAGKASAELLPLLKQSTSMISACSPSLRNTAFAGLKFERMAQLYLEGNMRGDSERAFRQSITEYIESGTLQEILDSGLGINPECGRNDSQSPAFMLGRVLTAFLKLKLRRKGSKCLELYDNVELDAEQRGMLLEWQMNLLCDLHGHCSSEEEFRAFLTSIVSTLLELYPADSHPIRRGRVLFSALRCLLEHPGCLESSLSDGLKEESTQAPVDEIVIGKDTDLAKFAQHITNSLRIITGFHNGKMDHDQLADILASWNSIIRQCADGKSLALCIHDTEYFVLQLKALVDYTEIHGLWKDQLSALELILRVAELQKSGDISDAIIILSRLVLQNCRLGHCLKASDLLTRGEQYLTQHKISLLAATSFKLARVEYLLETGETDKAALVLYTAKSLYQKSQKSEEMSNLSVLSKISWERLIADATFVQSRLSTAQGSMTDALYFAKLSVRLNCRIWAKVEKLAQRKQDKYLPASGSSEVEAIADSVARLDLSQNGSSPDVSASYIQGAPFWPHLGSHHTCLLNLAALSAHHGLFQDAIYYGQQALKIDKTLDASVRLMAAQTQLGCYWTLGGHADEGQELLTAALESSKQIQTSMETIGLHMALASMHKLQGEYEEAFRLLQEADGAVTAVISSDATSISEAPNIALLEAKMENLQVRSSRRTPSTTSAAIPARRTRAATSATASVAKKSSTPKTPSPDVQSKSLLRLKSDILRQQADCLRATRDYELSARTLAEARQFAIARESRVSLEIGESEHLLAQAIRQFASHAVYCVLPESTISLPSLKSPTKAGDEPSSQPVKPGTTKRARAPTRGTRAKAQRANEDFSIMLSKANDCLAGVFREVSVVGSTLESHAVSRLMSRISMLSHATSPGPAVWAQSPANMNEIGRVEAFTRERMAIDFDRQLSDLADPLSWPASSLTTIEMEDPLSSLAENYVDILPGNWNVLSLSLSADNTEFVVSRLQKDRSPFLIRLPLRRGNSDDDDEEQFTFEDGKEEMKEIIKLANESAHAAKAQIDKKMKKDWWKTRETLDRRMEGLLQNIENIWFGGFRGVFSPLARDTTALSRFSDAFQGILDKHLPSRQKGGKATSPRLTLHQNVIELFIGLRDLEQSEEPEDTLMDLLYFVVDILQFQGERNAYDEIDFDMMVVDTLDALRGYHEATREEVASRSPSHTVLVLDKALHLFPWESLPCLQGYPVCRVPSLQCLRERVLQFRESRSGALVDRDSGSFLLNPTGDLRTTQSTFEADLTGLKSWTGVVNREPTEDEFRDCLESKDLFLYFGHGSGAQYIRGRTIKRLSKCGVAFLMGCSSGTLTEAGEYEPYGTPMNYLHAGSPALVATLWDVTDKDIDRFASSTFDTWGLFEKDTKTQSQKQDVGLDTAIAGARGSCVLKYLNGAAPVVYGVPVFLS